MFQYLYRRGYGTSDYAARGTIRSLDKWVSDLIDFPKARYGYDYLKTTLKLMAEEVARRQAEFRKQMEQVEAIEDRYQDEVGLTQVMALGLGTVHLDGAPECTISGSGPVECAGKVIRR